MNVKILWIVSRLVGPQEGLSISTLGVEESILKVTHMFTTPSTVSSTITGTLFWFNFWENPDFDFRNLLIWLIIDKSIKNHQNLINRLDFCSGRTLIMMKFYFLVKFSVEMIHVSMKFSHIWINIENFPWKFGLIRSVFFLNFFRPTGANIFGKESYKTTQQYMICVSVDGIFEFRSHYYAVKCGLILRSISVHSF